MGKVVSGAAWEGPSGWGRWGGLSGTVSFPADGTCRLSQGHQACAVFWSHRPNLQRQSHSGRSGLAFGAPRSSAHAHSLPPSVLAGLPPCGRVPLQTGCRRWRQTSVLALLLPVCLLLQRPLKREAL